MYLSSALCPQEGCLLMSSSDITSLMPPNSPVMSSSNEEGPFAEERSLSFFQLDQEASQHFKSYHLILQDSRTPQTTNYLELILKCKFWLSRSGRDLRPVCLISPHWRYCDLFLNQTLEAGSGYSRRNLAKSKSPVHSDSHLGNSGWWVHLSLDIINNSFILIICWQKPLTERLVSDDHCGLH